MLGRRSRIPKLVVGVMDLNGVVRFADFHHQYHIDYRSPDERANEDGENGASPSGVSRLSYREAWGPEYSPVAAAYQPLSPEED